MGLSIIGGLTVSTILTLILVPVLYCVFAATGIKRQRRILRKKRAMDEYYEANKHTMLKNKRKNRKIEESNESSTDNI